MDIFACGSGSGRPLRGQGLFQKELKKIPEKQVSLISIRFSISPENEQKGVCPQKSYQEVNASPENQQALPLSRQSCYLIPQKTKDKEWHCTSSVTKAISQVMVCGVHYSRTSIKTLGRRLCTGLRYRIL